MINDGLRPGEVFHPAADYEHGRSAYPDISVRSTTQPSFISSSASCASTAVAAAAGEVTKDEKHLATMERVEWTPFALKTFCTIADCTTPRSGVPQKVARKNLLQQLSVQKWTNNAQMSLHYWG